MRPLKNLTLARRRDDLVYRVIRILLSMVVVLTMLLAGVNYVVRVGSDGGDSHGIIEQLLFGRSAGSSLTSSLHSQEFNHWNEANDMSARGAAVLAEHGSALGAAPRLSVDRVRAAGWARRAYEHSNAIPNDYLAASNAELPLHYKDFVQAKRLFAEGLERSNPSVVREGMEQHNTFLQWIQARDRNDFKLLK